jgi:curved DNA-binding protein
VRTPTGAVNLPVPEATPNGKRVRLKGKGLPRYKQSGNGDLYLDLVAKLPERIGPEQRELIERLARSA